MANSKHRESKEAELLNDLRCNARLFKMSKIMPFVGPWAVDLNGTTP